MELQNVEQMFEQFGNPDMLVKAAIVIFGLAVILTVVGMIFRTARNLCIIAALVMCLSGAGFFSKAQTVLEENLGIEIPMDKVHGVIESIKNKDLGEFSFDGEAFSAWIEDLVQ